MSAVATYLNVTSSTSFNAPSTGFASSWRQRGRLIGVLLVVILIAGLAGPSAPRASAASTTAVTTYHSSLGGVTASLSFRGTYPMSHGAVLTISTSGVVRYRHAVSSTFCGHLCWPQSADYGGSPNPVQVVRLGPGNPDVVVGLYSGGAHCCSLNEIFSPRSSRGYHMTQVFFGDPGAQLRTLPGEHWPVFVTADDSFAYSFTDYAGSGLPIKILRFDGGHMVNVTRQYRRLITLDAKTWLDAFYAQASTHYADSVGVIAAWAADEYLLGRVHQTQTFLTRELRARHLHSALNPDETGAHFLAQLFRFLRQRGY